MPSRRAIVLVIDGLGVGEAPDAPAFGDQGSNTLGHIIDRVPLAIPNFDVLGLRHTLPPPYFRAVAGVPATGTPVGNYGRLAELSAGKDTTTGHWELTGVVVEEPFPLYPDGFPADLMERFVAAIGRPVLGNHAASGTVIIDELGERHAETGFPIVYTSGDSVFQIACHQDVVPLEQLYGWCAAARRLLTGEHAVGRVIARPFTGAPGAYRRTHERRDYSLPPPSPTLLDHLQAAGKRVAAIGKISDIFSGRGISTTALSESNRHGIELTLESMARGGVDLIFTNLVDTDSKYGHRNDVAGYARCLEEIDALLPRLLSALAPDDLLAITGDHGCDPSDVSTDHTREYVPLLVSGPRLARGADLGTRSSFADLGRTLDEFFGLGKLDCGESFLDRLALA